MKKYVKRHRHSPYNDQNESSWYTPVEESSDTPSDDSFFIHAVVVATVLMAGLVVVFLKAVGLL